MTVDTRRSAGRPTLPAHTTTLARNARWEFFFLFMTLLDIIFHPVIFTHASYYYYFYSSSTLLEKKQNKNKNKTVSKFDSIANHQLHVHARSCITFVNHWENIWISQNSVQKSVSHGKLEKFWDVYHRVGNHQNSIFVFLQIYLLNF